MQQEGHTYYSFQRQVWRQFKKNKAALIALYLLLVLTITALLADFIANDQPLYARYKGKSFYPVWQTFANSTYKDSVYDQDTKRYELLQFDITDWRQLDLESVWWPLIPYAHNKPDPFNRSYTSPSGEQNYKDASGQTIPLPSRLRHKLGTNNVGYDVAAGIVHGTRIALRVGLVSMGIAAFIGLLLGALAGYFGDNTLYAYRGKPIMLIISLILGFFYGFIVRKYALTEAAEEGIFPAMWSLLVSIFIMIVIIVLVGIGLGSLSKYVPWLNKRIPVPIDSYVSRGIEIFDSMPRLLLILSIASLFREKSIFLVMAIIGCTSWTGIARLTRAEFLRNRSLDYIQAARALGYNNHRIIFRHALPNSIAPVFVSIAFGIASAILTESGLSFLGIGVPSELVTWGSLLSDSRQQFSAWWLAIFPGLAIFITVCVYNLIGEGLRDALDPRMKR